MIDGFYSYSTIKVVGYTVNSSFIIYIYYVFHHFIINDDLRYKNDKVEDNI